MNILNSMNSKKIIIITPKFPWPNTGACEQERFQGIKDLVRYGYQVTVISKVKKYQNKVNIYNLAKEIGIKLFLVDYIEQQKSIVKKILIILKIFFSFLYWDGATFEYTDEKLLNLFSEEIKNINRI